MEVGKVDSYPQWAVVSAPAPVSSEIRAEQDKLIQAVRSVNESMLPGDNREMTYSVDPATRRIVFKLIDKETQDVIRQVPPEYLLRLAEMSGKTE
jgi:flagellar protein FlaG